ncbi:cancer/testis antigen 55-like isoform X1 [Cricetulus griseus]|uniref:Cancer/testis antigen 55-like isoform X2 n=1 Tax=Cricetulus griseus TaxID=10029 RepID=A0A9J7GJB4_CRIGR|nr:cancer/testis antigen 55-like isoform X1 [Cricetulus griseus]XP_027287902.2 cancer/testis antigen 55-like isoform X2 [Cricetulus griseus]
MGVTTSRPSCCYSSSCSDCGISRLLRLLRSVVYFFQWKIESVERDRAQLEGEPNTKIVKGIVTSCGNDYGWIEDCVFFSTDVVIGPLPLQAGDKVLAFVEEDPLSHDLKATEVCVFSEDDKPRDPDSKIHDLSVCVSLVKKDMIYIADEYYFYLDSISKAILGFTPYEGDWLDIEYSAEEGSPKISIHSLKATQCRRLEEVRITSMHRRQGVLNHTIFFTLESLKRPVGYTPHAGQLVSAVIVQSIRPNYNWRAISMTPVLMIRGRCQGPGGMIGPQMVEFRDSGT